VKTSRAAQKQISSPPTKFVRQLGEVRDFQGMIQIQTEFMQSLVNAMGEQTRAHAEAYTKTAADLSKNPFVGMS
jgi:hypothetical protein